MMRVLILLLLLLCTKSYADTYFGFEVGQSIFEYQADDLNDVDEYKTSTKFNLGYAVNNYLAFEAAYFDTQEIGSTLEFIDGAGNTLLKTQGEFRVKNKSVSVVGSYRFQQKYYVYLSGGLSRWDTSVEMPEYGLKDTDTGTGYPVSLGMGVDIDEIVTLFIAANYLAFDAEFQDNEDLSVSTLSFGFKITP